MKKTLLLFLTMFSMLISANHISSCSDTVMNKKETLQNASITENSISFSEPHHAHAQIFSSSLIINDSKGANFNFDLKDLIVNAAKGRICLDPCKMDDNIMSFYIGLDNPTPMINIQYIDDKSGELIRVVADLDMHSYDYLLKNANANPTEEELNRVEEEEKGCISNTTGALRANKKPVNPRFPLSATILDASTIPETDDFIDAYMENSGWIHDDYWNYQYNCFMYHDNEIVNIVPKQYFTSFGDYICLGKEYGFYINTGYDYTNPYFYVSDVFVIDIEYATPMCSTGDPTGTEGILRINPLFQYRYQTRIKVFDNNREFYDYEEDPFSTIVTHHEDLTYSNYYIANPYVATTIENGDALNAYQDGYNPSTDMGAFITDYDIVGHFVKYNATIGQMSNSEKVALLESAFSILGTLIDPIIDLSSGVSTALSLAQKLIFSIIEQDARGKDEAIDALNNIVLLEKHYNYWQYAALQVNDYGALMRSVSAGYDSTESGLMLTVRNNLSTYFENRFRLGFTPDQNLNGPSVLLYNAVKFDIYGPNSFPARRHATPGYRGTVAYVFADKIALRPRTISSSGDLFIHNEYTSTIETAYGFKVFKIMPSFTDAYEIETTGPYDTYLSVLDSSGKQIAYNDDKEPDYFNAFVSVEMIARKTYYVIVGSLDDMPNQQFGIKIGKTFSRIYLGVPYTKYINFYEELGLAFIPTVTREYTISVKRRGGESDPQLYVYNQSRTQIAYNDDYIDEEPLLKIVMVANATYYLRINMTLPDSYTDYLTVTIQ